MLSHLRIAARALARRPAISAVAIVSLAIGIGVNSAIFSIVDAFLRPPAVEDPYGLVTVAGQYRDSGRTIISWPDYEDIRDQTAAFSELAAFSQRGASYREGDDTVSLLVTVVSESYFSLLGVRPALGRFPEASHDYDSDPSPPVTISAAFWRKRLGGTPDVIGRSLELTRRLYRVSAVLPAEFRGFEPASSVDVWMPAGAWTKFARSELQRGAGQWLAIGRLRPGVSMAQAQARLDLVARRIEADHPVVPRGRRLVAHSLGDELRKTVRPGRQVLAAVALVLLVACANVASVLLVHAEARRREIGIRMAVGASRSRLIGQLLAECAVLGLAGAGAGLLLARWLMGLVPALAPPAPIPVDLDIRVDHRFLLFTLSSTAAAVLVFGLAPIWHSLRTSVVDALSGGGRSSGRTRSWTRAALVTAQIAISVVLVGGATMLVWKLADARRIYTGLDSGKPMVLASAYVAKRGADAMRPFRDASDRIAQLPGVEAVTYARHVPLWPSGAGAALSVSPEGSAPDAAPMRVGFNLVGPRYFEITGAQILRGRVFSDAEQQVAARLAIVSVQGAARFWPGGDPMGRRLRTGNAEYEVIGIAADARNASLYEEAAPYIYLPFASKDWGEATMTRGSAAPRLKQVRSAIGASGVLRVDEAITLETHLDRALYNDWMPAVLGGGLAVVGLLLAAGGLYGAVSYTASRRKREFGVRVALGADTSDIGGLVFRQALALCAAGVPLGCAALALVWRSYEETFFPGKGIDPRAVAVAAAVTCAAVLVGALLPAVRSTRVDAAQVLRAE